MKMNPVTRKIKMVAIITLLIAPVLVQADNGYLQRQMANYEQSKRTLLKHFANGDSVEQYSRTIAALARSQVLMLSQGVPATDPRMVNRLAHSDGFRLRSAQDYPIFAYRVFKYELKRETGFRPDPARLFSGNNIYVTQVE